MDVRRIAAKALKLFEYDRDQENRSARQAALIGYFRGVADGRITVGQEWPVPLLIEHTHLKSKEEYSFLEDIFASGMLCQGQILTSGRER